MKRHSKRNKKMKAVKPQPKLVVLVAASLLVLIAIVVAVLFGGGNDKVMETTLTPPTEVIVMIQKDGFMPSSVIINQGDTIVWINKDIAPHAVVSNAHPEHTDLTGLFSDALAPDATYSYTFDQTGTFNYHDENSPDRNAVIEVVTSGAGR